jgi:hypothetical protein
VDIQVAVDSWMTSPTRRQKLVAAAVVVLAFVAVRAIAELDSGPVGPQPITNACVGKAVPLTANFTRVVSAAPAGTTFCLDAGTYTLTASVSTKPGDSFIGAGQTQTFIKPSGVGAPVIGFLSDEDGTVPVTFAQLDIGGFTVSPSSTTCNDDCGSAIYNMGLPGQGGLILRDVACHDNGTSCAAHGNGSITATRLDCYGNGFHIDSLKVDYRSSACLKLTEGSLVLRDSFIHDNYWDALWCDWCGHTNWLIENNVISHNGLTGIYWEMSGPLAGNGTALPSDNIIIRNNVIKDNGWNCEPTPTDRHGLDDGSQLAAGIVSEDGSSMLITGNTFGHNSACEELGFRAVNAYDGPRAGVVANIAVTSNVLSGDRLGGPVQGVLCTRPGVTCTGNV